MRAYVKGGIVLATHEDDQNVPASAYGDGVEVVAVPAGVVVTPGETMPEMDLAGQKAMLCGGIDTRRDAIIAAGYQHNFGAAAGVRTLDCRTIEDQANWLALHGLWSAMDPETMVEVIDAGNDVFETSAATGALAVRSLGQWKSALIIHARNLKNAALAAADALALAAIVVDDGWPGE
ncbi:hypothetical protein [Aurantimonas sp. 22II-16-19i]|uniref:hypothetical protein n=1 Tax=Aurantimonas sp. 22II-16-19i TaxID=1317114 RepID=UPI0009F7DAD3|nr:hypothetical protein [Aurantimonas sp. 22II-16-19i]ORE87750.1 hypothetical protein ATO4_25388 [Aurantimonas sp. 22II-16-19i]